MTWLGWGGLAVAALLGLAGGIGGSIVMAGVYAFAVAVVALLRGHVGWALLRGRAAAAGALAASIVVMGVGGAVSPAATPDGADVAAPVATSTPSSSSTASAMPSPTPTATPTPVDPVEEALDQAESGTALALLASVKVTDTAVVPGYARAEFGQAWSDTDHNGCDQRNDTLRRDLTKVMLKARTRGCTVWAGTLTDPYTGTVVTFTRAEAAKSAVAIDHVVPLADAWAKGASTWPAKKRTEFANDTLNLVATATAVNTAKAAADAARWLPPKAEARCGYLARQVAVKAKYSLAVTPEERRVMVSTLQSCADTSVPKVTVAKLGGWPTYTAPLTLVPSTRPTSKPKPSTKPKSSTKPKATSKPRTTTKPKAPSRVRGVHPGAFCSPAGALGYTTAGTLMKCSFKAGDSRARWRRA